MDADEQVASGPWSFQPEAGSPGLLLWELCLTLGWLYLAHLAYGLVLLLRLWQSLLRAWAASEVGGFGLDVQVWEALGVSFLEAWWIPLWRVLSLTLQGFSGQKVCCEYEEGVPAGAPGPAGWSPPGGGLELGGQDLLSQQLSGDCWDPGFTSSHRPDAALSNPSGRSGCLQNILDRHGGGYRVRALWMPAQNLLVQALGLSGCQTQILHGFLEIWSPRP